MSVENFQVTKPHSTHHIFHGTMKTPAKLVAREAVIKRLVIATPERNWDKPGIGICQYWQEQFDTSADFQGFYKTLRMYNKVLKLVSEYREG